jgi:hypothetical protein
LDKDGVVDGKRHAPDALHPENDPKDLNHDLAFEEPQGYQSLVLLH